MRAHSSPPPAGVIGELLRLHEHATEHSISGDLERARRLLARASDAERGEADRLFGALCHLERWLHDR